MVMPPPPDLGSKTQRISSAGIFLVPLLPRMPLGKHFFSPPSPTENSIRHCWQGRMLYKKRISARAQPPQQHQWLVRAAASARPLRRRLVGDHSGSGSDVTTREVAARAATALSCLHEWGSHFSWSLLRSFATAFDQLWFVAASREPATAQLCEK